jgi:hypothetical protein
MRKLTLVVILVSLLGISLFASGQHGGGQQSAAASGGPDVLKILVSDAPILQEGITHSKQDVFTGKVKSPMYDKLVSDLAKINIKLEFDFIQSEAYDTRFNTMLASNQMNNYDLIPAPPSLTQMGKLGLIKQQRFYPVNDIIDNHTSAGARKFFSTPEGKSLRGRMTFYDGKMYEISAWTAYHIGDPSRMNGGIFINPWIRWDWLQTLGIPMPENPDQLYDALKAFRDRDVNKNGVKDEVVNVPVTDFKTGIAQMFGLVFPDYLGSIGQLDRKAVSAWYQPTIKAYIQYMQKLYNAGLLRIKGADNDQAANKIAFTADWLSGANWLNAGVQIPQGGAPGSYMTPILFNAVPGTPALIWKEASVKYEGMYYVPAGTRKAAAIGRLLDYLFSDDYFTLCELGIEGYNFTRNAEGVAVKKGFADGTTPDEKWDFGLSFSSGSYIFGTLPRIRVDYRQVNGKDLFGADNTFKTTARFLAAGIANGYPDGYTKTIAFANDAFAGKYKVQDEINMYMAYPRSEEEAQNEAAWGPDLVTYSEELLTQLIMGQKPMDDASWNGYMADLKRLHLDDILSSYQARMDMAN